MDFVMSCSRLGYGLMFLSIVVATLCKKERKLNGPIGLVDSFS